MARDQLARCDVAALVIDAREGATAEDDRLASLIEDSGRCALVVLNKKDSFVGRAPSTPRWNRRARALAFLPYAPVLLTSATRGGVTTILAEASKALAQASRRIDGRAQQAARSRSSRTSRRRPVAPAATSRLYYATQASVRPPTFFLSTNHPAEVGYPYRRFLRLRDTYGFQGTPLRLILRAHKQKKAAPPAAVAAARARPARSKRQAATTSSRLKHPGSARRGGEHERRVAELRGVRFPCGL